MRRSGKARVGLLSMVAGAGALAGVFLLDRQIRAPGAPWVPSPRVETYRAVVEGSVHYIVAHPDGIVQMVDAGPDGSRLNRVLSVRWHDGHYSRHVIGPLWRVKPNPVAGWGLFPEAQRPVLLRETIIGDTGSAEPDSPGVVRLRVGAGHPAVVIFEPQGLVMGEAHFNRAPLPSAIAQQLIAHPSP